MSTPVNRYDIGDVVTLTGTFTVDDVLTDPTEIEVTILEPDGSVAGPFTLTAAEVVKESDGVFSFDFTPTQVGDHHYRIAGTGGAIGAEEGFFIVKERLVPAP